MPALRNASLAVRFERQAEDHVARIDALVAEFEHQLQALITRASVRTVAELVQKLAITNNVIDRTPGNQRILRSLDTLFEAELDRAGYQGLVDAFVGSFSGQLPEFQRVLDLMNERLTTPVSVKWSKPDLNIFSAQQVSIADSIQAAVSKAAALAQQKTLFAVAGLKVADMAEVLSVQFGRGVADAVRIADTGLSVFYRMVAARGYEYIQAETETALKYQPYGPKDRLNRPFCEHLMANRDREYTQKEIEDMDNGQLPNPFLTFGGYRCRHQWALSIADQKAA